MQREAFLRSGLMQKLQHKSRLDEKGDEADKSQAAEVRAQNVVIEAITNRIVLLLSDKPSMSNLERDEEMFHRNTLLHLLRQKSANALRT